MLAFSLLLVACGNGSTGGGGGGNNGGNNGGGAITDGVIVQGVQVKDATQITNDTFINFASLPDYNGSLDFNLHADGKPITDYVPGSSVKVTNGKLNMTLGTPKNEYLGVPVNFPSFTPSTTKFFEYFLSDQERVFVTSDKYMLYCLKTYTSTKLEIASLIYVDGNATAKATDTFGSYTYITDCSFKKGWNFVIVEENSSTKITKYTSSQTLPSGFYWVVLKQQ
jgi:hypothetical protein